MEKTDECKNALCNYMTIRAFVNGRFLDRKQAAYES